MVIIGLDRRVGADYDRRDMIENDIRDEQELEDVLSEPGDAVAETVRAIGGDVVVLGAGGKMGPTLAMMLCKASEGRRIYAVSRFTDASKQARIEQAGAETIEADLLERTTWESLPDAHTVFFLLGMKFGTTGQEALTWALNAYVPALAAQRYKDARIVALSTGNVYPFVEATGRGASERTPPFPVGEYAQSCLARERMFEHFSSVHRTKVTLIRLNYANEPRYGIIVDLTHKILDDEPIDLTMGAVNLIWQRDANDAIIQSVALASSPPVVLNVTGADTVSVRDLAERIGAMLDKRPRFVSREAPTALLSDASYCHGCFGEPATSLEQMVSLIVPWVRSGKTTLNKPTKYDVRDGQF